MSEVRSVERFKTLPLGGGRTENTVAYWYAQHGHFLEAKKWLKRSLAVNPQDSRAMDLYGRIAFEEHNPRIALQCYLVAITIRPDKAEFWQQLGFAVAASGGPSVGLGQIDTLMVGHQDNAVLWLERAMLLRACGRAAESAEAKSRAIQLSPGIAAPVDSLPLPTPP
jgi:tetratricopeptide (TPR) repeat protein